MYVLEPTVLHNVLESHMYDYLVIILSCTAVELLLFVLVRVILKTHPVTLTGGPPGDIMQ